MQKHAKREREIEREREREREQKTQKRDQAADQTADCPESCLSQMIQIQLAKCPTCSLKSCLKSFLQSRGVQKAASCAPEIRFVEILRPASETIRKQFELPNGNLSGSMRMGELQAHFPSVVLQNMPQVNPSKGGTVTLALEK